MTHLEEIKRINRREIVCDSWSLRQTQSSSCETQRQTKGVSMLKVKRRGDRGGRRALRRDQRLRVQKLENKEGINETHQHHRAITADVKVSKILEISDIIVTRSHYQTYCAVHLFSLVLLFIFLLQTWVTKSNTDIGRTI